MEALIAIVIGVLTAGGVFLALRGQTFPVVLGLTLMSYAVNLFLFVMGRLAIGVPPVISDAAAGLHRPAAAGAGAHRHRHQLRHDRLRHRAVAEGARRARQRPCRRPPRRQP
jgi:hypothetical protein